MSRPDFVSDLGDEVYLIDTGFQRPRFDAAYLVVDGGRAAFVDTGTVYAVPRLLAALASVGLGPEAVDWVIPTHVHHDHAGGVGALMRTLPNATCLVHPRGARHLIDPTVLYQGALAVYGADEMARSYGQLVGVPAERVQSSHDGQRIALGGRTLALIDTPGHARHHHCLWDERSRGWFTGDTFGLSYREFDREGQAWILPTSTPVQFEPDALRASIERLLASSPQAVYLTHYGKLGDVAALGDALLGLLERMVERAVALREAPERHTALRRMLRQLYVEDLHAFGSPLTDTQIADALAIDIELNAQGLAIWLDRT
jgi:glyoxylase-like metal-dependent hydrolase (beta-lactamase superfamily II)